MGCSRWRASLLPVLGGLSLGLLACGTSTPGPSGKGALRGTFSAAGGAPGDGYLFLYDVADPPLPKGSGRPAQVTAVPEPRRTGAEGPHPEFVVAELPTGGYLARGVVSVRGLFDPFVDVLAQPFAGDLVTPLQPLRIDDDRETRTRLDPGVTAAWEPPAFVVDSIPEGQVLTLAPDATGIQLLHLKAQPLPFGDAAKTVFRYGQADLNGDGVADDLDGDGTAETYPTVVLRRIAEEGDGPAFFDGAGKPLTIVIPTTVQPDFGNRGEQAGLARVAEGLFVVVPPIAAVVEPDPTTGKSRTRRLPALPLGRYQFVVITAEGQYWQVPNGLGPDGPFARFHGGPFTSQTTRVVVKRGR